MYLQYAVLVSAVLACLQVSATRLAPAKDRLIRDLMRDYESAVDPNKVELEFGLALICARHDKLTGNVVSHVWEMHFWKDSRLQWTPSEYGGVEMLRVPSKLVWKPDTRLYNTESSLVERDDEANVVIYPDGRVLWIPMATYRTLCQVGQDEISCKFKVGSWTYDENSVVLKPYGKDPFDLSNYSTQCPTEVTSHTAEVVSHKYPCCEEKYPSLDVSFTLKPRHGRFSTSDKSDL